MFCLSCMPKLKNNPAWLDQRGAVQFIVPLILLGGIIVGVYLVTSGPLKLFPKASVSSPIDDNGLVGYWKFDEGTGNTSADASGNNRTASFNTTTAWDTGLSGQATRFNGSDSLVSLPLNLNTSGQTAVKNPSSVSLWFKPNQDLRTTPQGILSSDSFDSCGSLRIESNSNKLYLSQRCYGFPYIDITGDNWVNQWVHLVVTIDSTGQKAYINGDYRPLISHGSQNINWLIATIGRRNSGGSYLFFDGLVDEVRVYNRVLNMAEVQQLYNLGVISTPTPTPQASKRVFVTSTTYSGNLGGLSGADAKCQDRANAASLGGTWKAWLSDSNTSVSSRFNQSTLPYKLISGTTIANNWTDLTDGTLQSTIDVTELGTQTAGWYIWTYTQIDGSSMIAQNSYNCHNWTTAGSAATNDLGIVGNNGYTNSGWTSTILNPGCNGFYQASTPTIHLYCFEQ